MTLFFWKNHLLKVVFLLLFIGSFKVKGQDNHLPQETPYYTFFFIGDAGKPLLNKQDPTLSLLEKELEKSPSNSSIIFLGDNIYQRGLPDMGHKARPYAQKMIEEQLKILEDFNGSVFFIPGNHDWDRSGREGWQRIRNQEQFVEDYLQKGNTFLPDNGCPGPVEVNLADSITLVVLDTQWFLHGWEKPGQESDCSGTESSAVIAQLEDILRRNHHKKVVVVSHHPMYSAGEHGGHTTFNDHLFPLTNLNPKLFIPLPVIGSIYPLYRKWFGDIQDLPHPKNRALVKTLTAVFRQHPDLIHAAGHEHALQHFFKDSLNYIVSGSGSKLNLVKKKHDAEFAGAYPGFAKIQYYSSGEVWMEFFTPEPTSSKDGVLYRRRISTKPFRPKPIPQNYTSLNYTDSTVFAAASKRYEVGSFKKWLTGSNYRSEWSVPIALPVFDLYSIEGGLTISKLGGGMQTLSLHLLSKDGRQFKLRSIEKFTENAIPKELKGTFANDLVQDQISASHPYGALVVPELAKSAGIFHTNPKAYYIPDDPRFEGYRSIFANTSALLEMKPDEDLSNYPNLGNSKNIVGTQKVIDLLADDNDHEVDQLSVLRARLFDLIIGDWDRHDGQWRWASYKKKGKGTLFKPIPIDRDQAFFVNEGLIPKIASRKWIMPKFQGFDEEIRDVVGFMHNARFFDRYFLNEPTYTDWSGQVDTLQMLLTDEAIEKAIQQWPKNIYDLSGLEIIKKLKARRDHLLKHAGEYYRFLAKEVDITGSNKHELFQVERLDDENTSVKVYKIDKIQEQGPLLYKRTFKTKETKEIRLFGLGGNDRFELTGIVDTGPLVRIIGGDGEDALEDKSNVKGLSRNVFYYDDLRNNKVEAGPDTKDLSSSDPGVNHYSRTSFHYDYLGPLLSLAYNKDDGVFLGAGVLLKKHGFRKEPFAVRHRLSANYSIATSSYNFRYSGDYIDAIRKWDLNLNMDIKAPNYVNNFFGLGNETLYDQERDIDYYRMRYKMMEFNVLFKNKLGNFQHFYIGPTFQRIELNNTPGRYISDVPFEELGDLNLFDWKNYMGLQTGYVHDKRNNAYLPTEGYYVNIAANHLFGINSNASDFTGLTGEMSYFWSFRIPSIITLATRFGGGINIGSYEFFQANTLGGLDNLRGYRRTRFSGKNSLYNNLEIRLKLISFKTYFFPGYAGILGFNDVGRVWIKEEDSEKLHWGYGGGIWISPFNKFVLSFMYGFSEEDTLPLVKLGFFF